MSRVAVRGFDERVDEIRSESDAPTDRSVGAWARAMPGRDLVCVLSSTRLTILGPLDVVLRACDLRCRDARPDSRWSLARRHHISAAAVDGNGSHRLERAPDDRRLDGRSTSAVAWAVVDGRPASGQC